MKRILLHIFIALILFMQGCIKEEGYLSACRDELLLQFEYTLNMEYANLFEAEVGQVHVHVFDCSGKYVDSFSEQGDHLKNEYLMRIPVPTGRYSVVVYGGDLTTYDVGELDATTNILMAPRKGETDISNFHIELHNTPGDGGYLHPRTTPDHLYVGLSHEAISAPNNRNITKVELIKNTKDIIVKVTGTDSYPESLNIHVAALNGRYTYDNSIEQSHGTFKHKPINTELQPNYMETNHRMMRLVLEQPPISRANTRADDLEKAPTLVINHGATEDPVYNENMIDQILSTQNYTSQDDFDREDQFVFEIKVVNDVIVSVSVNGWIINNINPDI